MEEIAAHPKQGIRGRWVMLGLGGALALCVAAFYAVALGFDQTRYVADAELQATEAEAAAAAWASYRRATGIAETAEGEAAAASLTAAADEPSARARAVAYREAIDAHFAAFAAEDTRIAAAWQADVLTPWQALRADFPFRADGDDADPAVVARLFNPASGAMWSVLHEHHALSEVELQGRAVARSLPEAGVMAARGARVRDALFGLHSPTIDVKLEVLLREGQTLEACGRQFEGGGWHALHWRQSDGGARLGPLDASGSPWGLLRLRHALETRPALPDLTEK